MSLTAFASDRIGRLLPRAALLVALPALAASAHASQYLVAHMWAWECSPPTSSGSVGQAHFSLDTVTHTLAYNISFSGLVGTETAAEIRNAPSGANGPVVVTLPLGTSKIQMITTTPALEAQLMSTSLYVLISSSSFPAGEIRGQINPNIPPTPLAYCLGDGTANPCPCGNASAVGAKSGCLNSLGTPGKLTATGTASVAHDSLVLSGQGMPNSAALYFQGTARVASGAGAVFGDGLRCAGGSIVRLGIKTNVAGNSQYPSGADAKVAIKGALPNGGNVSRDYQIWYRNAASFCNAETYNLTNGLEVVWIP